MPDARSVAPDAWWVRYGKDSAVRVGRFSQLSRAWEAVPALADREIEAEIVLIPRILPPPTVDCSETTEESLGEPASGSYGVVLPAARSRFTQLTR